MSVQVLKEFHAVNSVEGYMIQISGGSTFESLSVALQGTARTDGPLLLCVLVQEPIVTRPYDVLTGIRLAVSYRIED